MGLGWCSRRKLWIMEEAQGQLEAAEEAVLWSSEWPEPCWDRLKLVCSNTWNAVSESHVQLRELCFACFYFPCMKISTHHAHCIMPHLIKQALYNWRLINLQYSVYSTKVYCSSFAIGVVHEEICIKWLVNKLHYCVQVY